tara:strand:+ start:2737 stop:3912 length:1176 start_codon:yes stop_codon:yes gene_type:complete
MAEKEEPKVDEKVEKIKIKKKPKIQKQDISDEPIKIDLSKPVEKTEEEVVKIDLSKKLKNETTITEDNANDSGVVAVAENAKSTQEQEKVQQETETQKQPIVEVTNEEPVKLKLPKQPDLPENIQKVVEFMKDTGGDLNDYINLNRNYDDYGDDDLLRTYYKDTKPHLEDDEINFLVQESFDWDESIDDEKDVKRKKLALKEQVASAKSHLDGLKSKYYEDIKMGSKLTEEQQGAIEFFNESKEQQKVHEQAKNTFLEKTDQVFSNDFKGFEYKIGDKTFRYNVGDAEKVKTTQSDINNFVRKFLNKDNQMENASGYHKGLFTAMNSDAIANHFYEQGKADALKESIAKSKNVSMDPRQSHGAQVQSGMKFRVMGDTSSSDTASFKIKKRK